MATWDKAVKNVGVDLQIDTAAAVAQAPEDFESRLRKLEGVQLERVTVKFPDPYDLVLMKICRSADIDRQDIEHIHKVHALNPDELLKRFREELAPIYVGNPADLALKYEFTVDLLFGEQVASVHAKQIRSCARLRPRQRVWWV
mgnify:CR=1 FL=1